MFFCLNILFRFPSSPGLLTSSCASCETFVCFRMASRTAAEGDAVWQGGGLHQFDDRDRPRASDSHPESPAHHEPECKGEGLLRTSASFTFLTLIFSDFPFQSFLFLFLITCTFKPTVAPFSQWKSAVSLTVHPLLGYLSCSWFWSCVVAMVSPTCRPSRPSWTKSTPVVLN